MRYISKKITPVFFVDDTKELNDWSEYYGVKKRKLRTYILKHEQNYLCIYCESKISISNSHVEHIRPKSNNLFPELTFNYENLVVSCNGTCHSEANDNKPYSCGHIKDTDYNEGLFLNPVDEVDIRGYFSYEYDLNGNVIIAPTEKNALKSRYMIETLGLNDGNLPRARKLLLTSFRKIIGRLPKNKQKSSIDKILSNNGVAFISMLVFKFNH